MTKMSTVPYAYEPGLIVRLLGMALEAVNAYGVKVTAYMNVCMSLTLINSPIFKRKLGVCFGSAFAK
jgi:hypothetical protein